jgi:hypothetical protein
VAGCPPGRSCRAPASPPARPVAAGARLVRLDATHDAVQSVDQSGSQVLMLRSERLAGIVEVRIAPDRSAAQFLWLPEITREDVAVQTG